MPVVVRNTRPLSLAFSVFFMGMHLLGAVILLHILLIVVITINHGILVFIASAWTPIFLFVVPTTTLLLSAGVVFLKQPVHNLLCLITVFFTTVLLYVYTGAEFLAFLFLIVYVGAIAILFLFVIMLLHLKKLNTPLVDITKGGVKGVVVSIIVVVLGLDHTLANGLSVFFTDTDLIKFNTVITSSEAISQFVALNFYDIHAFSIALYTSESFLFFLAGLLLLTAMLGAIILATATTELDCPSVLAKRI
jgi:NADH-quinone oxidoreductase subunit J